jgi:tetratricopeptide (TPR) repeat protein
LGARAFDPHDLRQLRRARHAYERALRLDPSYVPALTGIARCLTKEALVGRQRDEERVAKALELAARAEKIDPLDPNGPREKAHASLYLHDIDAGLAFVEVALSRARHHADIMAEKAEILVHASRHKQARATVLQAIELNPLAPDIYFWTLGSAEFFLGRPEAAVMALERMKRPEAASRLMSASAFAAGDRDKSERYRQAFLFNYPDATVDSIRSFMPHKNRADVEAYIDALRRAGFP